MNSVTNAQRAQLLEDLLHTLVGWKGERIAIVESISRRRSSDGHDRHFATRTTLSFTLESASCAVSGARIILLGEDNAFCYEIALDALVSATIDAREVTIVEHFEANTERLSTVKLFSTSE